MLKKTVRLLVRIVMSRKNPQNFMDTMRKAITYTIKTCKKVESNSISTLKRNQKTKCPDISSLSMLGYSTQKREKL